VHGIGNKPVASVLKCQWDTALFGAPLGDRSRMTYWVNREFYPVPIEATCSAADSVEVEDDEATSQAIMALASRAPEGERAEREEEALRREIRSLAHDDTEQEWLWRIAGRMRVAASLDEEAVRAEQEELIARRDRLLAPPRRAARGSRAAGAGSYEAALEQRDLERQIRRYSARVLPLPPFLRRLVTGQITRAFLRDVNDFLFDTERRRVMTQALADRLNAGGGPFAVIAHSQGSMIAYEVLRHLTRQDCDVKLFLTIGSPLGLQEVQDAFLQWDEAGLRVPQCVGRWVNVADRLDPVAMDSDLIGDFEPNEGGQGIENFRGWGLNEDSPRHPHSATGYLRTHAAQHAMREAVGSAFGQSVGRAVIARDLSDNIENSLRDAPHRTLIQLTDEAGADAAPRDLREVGDRLESRIREIIAARPSDMSKDAAIDRLKRYIAADLTRLEIEQLRTQFTELSIQRVWRNAEKRALINRSTNTVQARTANLGYGATGLDVGWAVVDTGIAGHHPHFAKHRNVKVQWDCTIAGEPQAIERTDEHFDRLDGNGHGTHVAGIIAGELAEVETRGGKETFAGIAPMASLYGFKVLDDEGRGHDSSIIKALDKIADLNDGASRLIIHGVNLSLGGAFDPSVYGCGHTPLCEELRRLWRQGVLVCLAAGNEGYAILRSEAGELPANIDISIGDPANLEEAIAVGSVHKRNPHTFGISYFSSRGPTADGRGKPDLVAPGEQILSALHAYPRRADGTRRVEDLYVEMSGTSMAAPHVSGILAAYLSVRREFQGYPEKMRQILLSNCTDLGRDPYMQGRGLPNLVRMLANT
jgi:subtilisin family serine protease